MFNERFLSGPTSEEVEFSEKLGTFVVNKAVAEAIDGLEYYPEYLPEAEEEALVRKIDSHSFSTVLQRRQQFYGKVYFHTKSDNRALQPCGEASSHPLEVFEKIIERLVKDGFFGSDPEKEPNQVLVNEYTGNIGIRSHFEDVFSFGEVIVTVSLNDPIWITLKNPLHHLNSCPNIKKYTRVLLQPRSVFVMAKEARYDWRHGITKTKNMLVNKTDTIRRGDGFRRLSLTIRKLLDTRKKAAVDQDGWFDSDRWQGAHCHC